MPLGVVLALRRLFHSTTDVVVVCSSVLSQCCVSSRCVRCFLHVKVTLILCSAKTRIQAVPSGGRKKDLSILSVILKIYGKEGLVGLFRGFGATMLNTFSMRESFSARSGMLSHCSP